MTIVATLRPDGLRLGPQFRHNVDATITSFKQPGKALGRAVAAMLGMNQAKITQKVYEGAIGKIRQNVVTEAAELGQEKTARGGGRAERPARAVPALRQRRRGDPQPADHRAEPAVAARPTR